MEVIKETDKYPTEFDVDTNKVTDKNIEDYVDITLEKTVTKAVEKIMDINDNSIMTNAQNGFSLEQGEIIIEELARSHKLLHRHRLNQNSITIGRGYHNDIILTDPYTCPQHLSLNYSEGTWKLNDNSSINGTSLENSNFKKQHVNQQVINDGDVIILGKSQLRVRFKSHRVADTIRFSSFEYLIDFIRNPFAVVTSIAIFMLIAAYNTYLNQTTEVNISQLFVSAFSKGLLFASWPAGVALVSLFTKNEPRILAQLGISFTFYILMSIIDFAESILVFNSASNLLLNITSIVVSICITYSLFWLNGYIGFHTSAKRRVTVALSITAVLFGGSYLLQYSKKPEFDPYPRYSATIMSPSYLISSSNNVDDFVQDTVVLFDKASKAVGKE